MRSRSLPKARFAAILLVLAAASTVAFLAACPPSAPRSAPAARSQQQRQTVGPITKPDASGGAAPVHPQPEKEGLLSIIIDDAGYSMDELQAFLDLPGPLTVAVLPNLPHSQEAARRVLAAGKNLILHCPMEAAGGENPGPGALRTDQSPQEIEALLAAAFASVPGAQGMNNHMGSKATADEALMNVVLGWLKREGKYYVDSRTTSDTVGPRIALRLGVPFLQRDVFIDVGTSDPDIIASFEKGVEEARIRGSAVMIGHVQNKAVVGILREAEKNLPAQGVRLARLTDVLKEREGEPAS